MNADVTVREVMDREYVGVSESDDLVDTVELLLREDADTALVLRGTEPVGVVTERDVLALVVDGPTPEDATVADAMTESLPTVPPDTTLAAAANEMSAMDARRLVVTETNGDEPLGLITEHDLLATSTYGRTNGPEGAESPQVTGSPTTGAGTAMAADMEGEPQEGYEDQGICERCGTLSRNLTAFNGQLLCGDCRDV